MLAQEAYWPRVGARHAHGPWTRAARRGAARGLLLSLVRARTDSLTCGLLQVKSARSSATSSALTATRKELTRLVTGMLTF